MFFIKVHGHVYEFANKPEDDFIRFLPEKFQCDPEEMEIFLVPKAIERQKRRESFLNPGKALTVIPDLEAGTVRVERLDQVEIDEEYEEDGADGKKQKKTRKVKVSRPTKVAEIAMSRIAKWPYSVEGVSRDGKPRLKFNPPKES